MEQLHDETQENYFKRVLKHIIEKRQFQCAVLHNANPSEDDWEDYIDDPSGFGPIFEAMKIVSESAFKRGRYKQKSLN